MKVSVAFEYEIVDIAATPERKAELEKLQADTVAPKFVTEGRVFTLSELQEMSEEGTLAPFLAGDLDVDM